MILLPLASLLAAAAPPAPGPNAIVDAVEACRTLTEQTARLACFDRTVATMATARAQRELMVIDRAQVSKTRKSLFGFTIPSFRLFGGSDKDDEAEQITRLEGKVVSGNPSGYLQYTVVLEDGSVWQTTENSPGFSPRKGETIIIRRSPFGYMAKHGYSQARIRRTK